jgi:hypothetical protein
VASNTAALAAMRGAEVVLWIASDRTAPVEVIAAARTGVRVIGLGPRVSGAPAGVEWPGADATLEELLAEGGR